MPHIDGCPIVASTANKDAFIEQIRTQAPRVNGPHWRTKTRSAVIIGVLANQGGMRV